METTVLNFSLESLKLVYEAAQLNFDFNNTRKFSVYADDVQITPVTGDVQRIFDFLNLNFVYCSRIKFVFYQGQKIIHCFEIVMPGDADFKKYNSNDPYLLIQANERIRQLEKQVRDYQQKEKIEKSKPLTMIEAGDSMIYIVNKKQFSAASENLASIAKNAIFQIVKAEFDAQHPNKSTK